MLDPDAYLPSTKPALLVRLVEVETSLGELFTDHHISVVALARAKQASYQRHFDEKFEATKNRLAEQETFALWEEVGRLAAEILVYTEERDMIKFLIGQYNG